MKTYNKHPQWYNQPLRLTKEQKHDPLPVLDDFFECYHLNEVRQTLWEWLTEVLSSHRSISDEGQTRNDHLYFYEKIEGIIEVAFVLKKKIHKHRRRKEKRRLKESNQRDKFPTPEVQEDIKPDKLQQAVETVDNTDIFNKPKQLLEYVDEAPMHVITEVFKKESLALLHDRLRDWLHVALSAESSVYDDGDQRRQLLSFQEQLLELVEALFIINTWNREKPALEKHITENDKPRLLSQDQLANPMQVIAGFFKKFPIVYIIRELNDWHEASICFSGTYPDNMDELQALWIYRNALCLIKAANRLLTR
jgi:hypothetical protein